MRPALRLAISNASGRRSRTALLVGAVALAAALISAIACGMASLSASLDLRLSATVGRADIKLEAVDSGERFPVSFAERIEAWPEVASVVPRVQFPLGVGIRKPVLVETPDGVWGAKEESFSSLALGFGVAPEQEWEIRPLDLLAGRLPEREGEVVIDALLATRLGWEYASARSKGRGFELIRPPPARRFTEALDMPDRVESAEQASRINTKQGVRLGDTIEVVRLLRAPIRLTVVGVSAQPPLGGRPQCWVTLETAQRITGEPGRISEADVLLVEGADPVAVVAAHAGEFPNRLLLQPTAKVTSGLEQNTRSSQLGFILASILAFLSASFIILTGLTTDVAQRQRELAILRCIGATRTQIATAQLFTGVLIGSLGALIGVPLGIGIAGALVWFYSDQVPSGLVLPPVFIALAVVGSVVAGGIGAAWPAYKASRLSPLQGLAARAMAPTARALSIVLLLGLIGIMIQALIIGLSPNGQIMFWGYALVGLPAMYIGYFMLGAPITLLVAKITSGPISGLLGLPNGILFRTIAATPYRHGFTAGALMGGLGLMISIWTNGGSILRDWLDKIDFPDAFVSGLALSEDAQRTLDGMPFVDNTCAITLQPVEVDTFGVRALQQYKTTFIAFEPRRFFDMTQVSWVQGEREEAIERLEEGGAVIVAREFLVAQGLGVGDSFTCTHDDESYEFEIVGVVTSPGLEIVSKFFNIGEDFTEQAVHAVFGSRKDLKEKFGSDAINLIQIDLADGTNDEEAIAEIREALFGSGVLDAGSGRKIKYEIRNFASTTLVVFSGVAMIAVLIACFGVANVIVAGIDARQFEFGVLRAVGAQRSLLTRLVLAEALVMALSACVLGILIGTQGSWAGQRLYQHLMGLSLSLRPPPLPILAGSLIVIGLALLAAGPAVYRLSKRKPRELLGSAPA